MSFCRELREEAMRSFGLRQRLLYAAADEISGAVLEVYANQTADALKRLNGAWAKAVRLRDGRDPIKTATEETAQNPPV